MDGTMVGREELLNDGELLEWIKGLFTGTLLVYIEGILEGRSVG
jgi:hypothetical protein